MSLEERRELKREIIEEIKTNKHLIENLAESVKPVTPDNAIGRLTRMEAIGSRAVSEASMNSAKAKLSKLDIALEKVDQPDFGICRQCEKPIPRGRIMAMPENVLCVPCAEKR